ncbi:hypothetical protein AWB71_04313 [Caballeronia peredens]|nr:hypothetical protein AWB71_04313 [Caballeronia peredens]
MGPNIESQGDTTARVMVERDTLNDSPFKSSEKEIYETESKGIIKG